MLRDTQIGYCIKSPHYDVWKDTNPKYQYYSFNNRRRASGVGYTGGGSNSRFMDRSDTGPTQMFVKCVVLGQNTWSDINGATLLNCPASGQGSTAFTSTGAVADSYKCTGDDAKKAEAMIAGA